MDFLYIDIFLHQNYLTSITMIIWHFLFPSGKLSKIINYFHFLLLQQKFVHNTWHFCGTWVPSGKDPEIRPKGKSSPWGIITEEQRECGHPGALGNPRSRGRHVLPEPLGCQSKRGGGPETRCDGRKGQLGVWKCHDLGLMEQMSLFLSETERHRQK